MLVLCSFLGGSHAYSLANENSDIDERGVFLNEDISYIVGLDTNNKSQKFTDKRSSGEDVFYYELRKFLESLRKTNSQAVELLFNKKWISLDGRFEKYILGAKHAFLDSEYFYHSLKGYIHNEKRLMNGERTGLLGSKRKNNLEQFGFSYKNCCQILRLLHSSTIFYRTGEFPVDMSREEIHPLLMQIKTRPDLFTKKEVNELVDRYEPLMHEAFLNREIDYKFDNDYANWVCAKFYAPIIFNYTYK